MIYHNRNIEVAIGERGISVLSSLETCESPGAVLRLQGFTNNIDHMTIAMKLEVDNPDDLGERKLLLGALVGALSQRLPLRSLNVTVTPETFPDRVLRSEDERVATWVLDALNMLRGIKEVEISVGRLKTTCTTRDIGFTRHIGKPWMLASRYTVTRTTSSTTKCWTLVFTETSEHLKSRSRRARVRS